MAVAHSLERVLVTGARGYIGSHIVHQLLSATDELGRAMYTVRGAVRDVSDEPKCNLLRDMAAKIGDDAARRLELVSADITNDEGWDKAMEGCAYVHHLASPPCGSSRDRSVVIKPAVEGVERVLNAAAKEKSVKRVILTSSMAAVTGGGDPARSHKPNDHVFTEEDWSDPELCPPYVACKTVSEQRAWELWKALPEESRFGLVVLNPSVVIGPLVMNNANLSPMLVINVLRNVVPALPRLYLPFVDVRDVAKLHVMAMSCPGVVGHRYMLMAEEVPEMSYGDIGRMLQAHYGPQGYKCSTWDLPDFLISILKYLASELKDVAPLIGLQVRADLSKTKSAFDFEYIPVKQSILEGAESGIDFGLVPVPKGGRRTPPESGSGNSVDTTPK